MIRMLPLALVLFGLGGCGEPFSNAPFEEDAQYLRAAPSAARLQLGGPGSLNAATAGVLIAAEPAEFYVYTRRTMLNLNGTALKLLHDVDRLLEAAPDVRGADERVWAPAPHALDPLEHRFAMQRADDGFDFALRQRRRGSEADLVPTLYGHFVPGDGVGHLTVDLDAVAAMRGVPVGGLLHLEYRFEAGATHLTMNFDNFVFGGAALNAAYHFERAPDGGGFFDFGGPGDDGRWLEVRARWRADGAGRADVYGETFVLSECWGTDFGAVYRATTIGEPDPVPACAFMEASRPESTRVD